MKKKPISILIIYTGGTIGMIQDPLTGSYSPFNFQNIIDEVPEIKRFGYNFSSVEFDTPVDSSNITPASWIKLAEIIKENYKLYDGFVILHGTDTMAFTASALSFMLENLSKPVILTGSQLPINMLRTDGKENLISSIEIAAAKINGKAAVPEVCIYFEFKLYRGNRTKKRSAENFNAFESPNLSPLAEAGIHISYNHSVIKRKFNPGKELKLNLVPDTNITILKIFPGIHPEIVRAVINIPGLRAVILETYGSGNAPDDGKFIEIIADGIENGLVIVNVTQCSSGSVEMERYSTGNSLKKIGVVSGYDITTEAAVTKLMILLGMYKDKDKVKKYFQKDLAGEISVHF
ncbi:MAG TPA: type I asparaginase [Spirochaetota bacterium]|nr:type I asparaginase [Spirochaetota bacterium]